MRDPAGTLSTHRAIVGRFAQHLAAAPDGSARIPHLSWTVAELGAHVLSGLRAYTHSILDDTPMWPDAYDGATGNRMLIQATPETDPAAQAAAIPEALDAFHEALEGCTAATVAAWGHLRVPPLVLPGMHVGDLAVHGWDLSRATRAPWRIERAEALTTLEAMLQIVPHFVNTDAAAGLRATFGIRLRGGPAWTLTFDDGALEVTEGEPARADCRLLNDAVAFLLLAYQRVPLWKVASTGKAVAYGRKPWLAFRFPTLLAAP